MYLSYVCIITTQTHLSPGGQPIPTASVLCVRSRVRFPPAAVYFLRAYAFVWSDQRFIKSDFSGKPAV